MLGIPHVGATHDIRPINLNEAEPFEAGYFVRTK